MAERFSTFLSTFTRPAPSNSKPSVTSYEEDFPPLGSSSNKGKGKTSLMGTLKPMSRKRDLHDIAQMTCKETDLTFGTDGLDDPPGLSVSDGPVIFETKSSAIPIKVSPRLRNYGCHTLTILSRFLLGRRYASLSIQNCVVIHSANGSREKPLNGRNARDRQRSIACKHRNMSGPPTPCSLLYKKSQKFSSVNSHWPPSCLHHTLMHTKLKKCSPAAAPQISSTPTSRTALTRRS